jgi:hypothetical protein
MLDNAGRARELLLTADAAAPDAADAAAAQGAVAAAKRAQWCEPFS